MMTGGRTVNVIEIPNHAAIVFLRDSRRTNPNIKFITYRQRGNGPLEEVRFRANTNPLRKGRSVA